MKDIVFAKVLDYSLNTQINNLEDLKQNMRSLNNFQDEINKLQSLKNNSQIEHNGLALTLIRKYVMEKKFGCELMRNLIRKYYPLNDEQIFKYETKQYENSAHYYITNFDVIKRKGYDFTLYHGRNYYAFKTFHEKRDNRSYTIHRNVHEDITKNMTVLNSNLCENIDLVLYNPYLYLSEFATYSGLKDNLAKNLFTQWNQELIDNLFSNTKSVLLINNLLSNKGYIAQQGIDNIENTIQGLQDVSKEVQGTIAGSKFDFYIKKYRNKPYELYSYLPLTESFVLKHQDELNWQVLDENPRIEWTLQLVSILLDKFELLSDPEQQKGIHGSKIMYEKVFDGLLNDEIISDLEKLYDL